ncbi:hypothetical protein PTSG_00774 [Salpingoeca rosetta]|uniref:Uncharacterized protein n=1 Tax=Salpingoeca rosetta (strain ATCC 50818 / BSB-021) TaxID=946362 RepID=F2TXF6_SALR5|nr:uncharacterized protein PTSG_00774 [Salpingoeca rosetta]EGD76065.1 hypothetical protein PTSG_00774 [Salpingoeca rosetta]|eukprot:XP_004998240.1 hypothetical protein PTSG_00774 [Salpingoeca rosetta]
MTTTVDQTMPPIYVQFDLHYEAGEGRRDLPLAAIARAGDEVVKEHYPMLRQQPTAAEAQESKKQAGDDSDVPNGTFEVLDEPLDLSPRPMRFIMEQWPFFARLAPNEARTGWTISLYFSHKVTDGFSIGRFLKAWSEHYAHRTAWPKPVVAPDTIEAIATAKTNAEPCSGYIVQADAAPPTGPPTFGQHVTLRVTRDELAALRTHLMREHKGASDATAETQPTPDQAPPATTATATATSAAGGLPFSCNDLRMALVWKAFVEANAAKDDELTGVSWSVNMRKRSAIPDEYFGNAAVMSPVFERPVGEVRSMSLYDLAAHFRAKVQASTSEERVNDTVAYLHELMAARGPVSASCVQIFRENPLRILYSDWSAFDVEVPFEGIRPRATFSTSKWAVGVVINTSDQVVISVKEENVAAFTDRFHQLLAPPTP